MTHALSLPELPHLVDKHMFATVATAEQNAPSIRLTRLGTSAKIIVVVLSEAVLRSCAVLELGRSASLTLYWKPNMGVKNFLIDGVSCAGKTTVCDELQRRGYHAIHGDRELAYWGDPKTGEPVNGCAGEHRTWMWNIKKVRALVADHNHAATFFCGGSRNSDRFIDLLDGVFVLEIDLDTLNRRLAARPEDEWGGSAREGESFARLQHATKEGLPTNAIIIDATAPLSSIVDTILEHANLVSP